MRHKQILLLSSFVQFALFIPLARWARKQKVLLSDIAITHLLQKKQTSFARTVVKVLNTLTGSAVFLNVPVVPIFAVLWRMRLRMEAVMIIATCWSGGLIRSTIKQVVDRPRPNPLLVHVGKQTKGKSFPSGHGASSVCFWGWLFTLALPTKKAWPGRKALLGSAALCVAFTGPARVYLGDHCRNRNITTYVPVFNKSNISTSRSILSKT
jgi:membrane-associated phospholipid phosphatase